MATVVTPDLLDKLKQRKPLPDLNYRLLDRELDRVKSKVFLGKNAAFLGPLMCSMNFSWTCDISTACTNGITLWWNPRFFLKMKPKVRPTVLLHELWHPALLHMLRRGSREPYIWNLAGDIVINNMLDSEGNSFEGLKPWLDHQYDGMPTEEVYECLIKRRDQELEDLVKQFQKDMWGHKDEETGLGDEGDIVESDDLEDQRSIEHTVINNVVSAAHAATISGGAGDMPGEVQVTLKRFLSPKLPWDRILHQFFNELANLDYTWARPNRRYQDMYLPALQDDRQGLDHILYFQDVSGSISDGDSIRFNSEFKYVKDTYNPEKLTMLQFDTTIQKEDVFLKDDPFEEILIEGRGGTSLICVRDEIIKREPTAVVVFSDLECDVMEPLPAGLNIPIIWVALNNRDAKVAQGQIVHLNE
jgi:predicted metal-dependent peptidase